MTYVPSRSGHRAHAGSLRLLHYRMQEAARMPLAQKKAVAGRREERFDTTLAVRLEQGGGVARNVSANGIYFITDIVLQKGEPVRFSLDFAGQPGGALIVKCLARVVRVEPCDGKLGVAAAISDFEFLRVGGKKDERDQ